MKPGEGPSSKIFLFSARNMFLNFPCKNNNSLFNDIHRIPGFFLKNWYQTILKLTAFKIDFCSVHFLQWITLRDSYVLIKVYWTVLIHRDFFVTQFFLLGHWRCWRISERRAATDSHTGVRWRWAYSEFDSTSPNANDCSVWLFFLDNLRILGKKNSNFV